MNLKPELRAEFIRHAELEIANGVYYLQAYSILRATGWEGFSKIFKNDAADEFGHAQNWIKYLARRLDVWTPSAFEVASFPKIMADSENGPVSSLFQFREEREVETRDSMEVVADLANSSRDEAALQWVTERLVDQELEAKKAIDLSLRIEGMAKTPGMLDEYDDTLERKGLK